MRRLPIAITISTAVAAAAVVWIVDASQLAGPDAGAASDCAKSQDAYTCRTRSLAPTTTPSPTSATTNPSAAGTGSGCVTSLHSGSCGPYADTEITSSNGYNIYVGNNMWGCGPDSDTTSCGPQTLTASSPGSWQVVSTQPAGNTGVLTYPDVQQLTTNWNGSGWGGNGTSTTPIASLTQLTSSYAETMPRTAGTNAQAAWDIWLDNNSGHPSEVMVWVDNVNRGDGGATLQASATIHGQAWSLYQYGDGELIWSLGAPGTFEQQASGTVDLLDLLRYLQTNGYTAAEAVIGQIDFGWEICSTGGVPGTFAVSSYSVTMAA